MIKRIENHKLVGFVKSGVSASDFGFVNVINSTIIDLNEQTGTPTGLVHEDAFGVSVINNSDYDCLDPVVDDKQFDLGAL